MAETWLKSCTKVPYPDPLSRLDQYGSGVPNGGNPYGNSMQFIVNHVVAGMFSPSNQPNDVMRARGNSWCITLFRDGHAEQHFPLEAMCWHAGAKANYRSDGVEWEGGTNHSGPTTAQKAKGIEVESEIARFRGWTSVKKGSTGHEHNEFMSTGCPGFPIPWSALEAGTKVQAPPTPTIWDEVQLINEQVTLYKNTNLVRLPDGTFVKALAKDTKLAVKGLWRGTHYITVYSYDRKIPNGFLKSATIEPAPTPPPPPPPTFWDDVVQTSGSVTLYQDTNLVELPRGIFVKKLLKGTKLLVKGIWKNGYYITVYSFDHKIQNGFAIAATIEPDPIPEPEPTPEPTPNSEPDCSEQEAEIINLKLELSLANQNVANRDATITGLRSINAHLESEADEIRKAIKTLIDYSA